MSGDEFSSTDTIISDEGEPLLGTTAENSPQPIFRLETGKSQPVKGRYVNSHHGRSFDTNHFAARVRVFANLLSPDQLARVRSRSRFHSMPHLRRADSPNPDDLLP